MLDYFCIFARGGALLWTYQLTALKGGPVDALIRNCLLQERVGDKSYNYEPPQGASYTLKWTLHNVSFPTAFLLEVRWAGCFGCVIKLKAASLFIVLRQLSSI